MIKKFFSRYQFRYPRALVYMLQATEYKTADYLTWYRATQDFTQIEKRKNFVGTKKSYALLVCVWLMVISLCYFTLVVLFSNVGSIKYIYSIIILLVVPYLLGYLILIPLFVIKLFQQPVEYFIIRSAREKVKKHKAIKIGIAGSYGKTTMREILKTVLLEGKKVAAPPHSYNTLLGASKFIQSLDGTEEVIIFELGEYYPGDIKELCSLTQPDVGIITGVNEAHLEKFKTLDSTVGTIFELADYLQQKPVYINGENSLVLKNKREGHIVYNRESCGVWRVENAHTDLSGTEFTLLKDDKKLRVTSGLLGLHHIGPLVAAAAIASRLGLSDQEIQRGINNTKPFDHRLEPKFLADEVVMLDDSYNGNPDGVAAVINFLASLKGQRRFYVTPGLVEMGSQKEEVHREIGHTLARSGIEKVILIRNSVTPYIYSGLTEGGYLGEVIFFDTGPESFAALPHLTVRGDVVLLQNDWPDQYR